ncbi:MAG: LysR family transcriptional regulator [Acetatifactor sp.]|nr:LysR family transcriptional regulator [Acetatifactor sp.]
MLENLEYLKVFYHVAKCGNLTRAASELAVSQPAVSQSLKQLEEQLQTELFVRASRGVKLTKEGQMLFEYVERGYEQMSLGIRKLEQLKNLEAGEIRIGASDMTLQFYLLSYLEQFHEKYPAIKVIVTNGPTPATIKLLQEGRIDFGVVSSPVEAIEGINVTPVREIEDVFVAGRRFISYKNKMLDLQELEKMPLICLEGSTSTRSYMDDFLAKNDVYVHPEFELATSDMIVQFALKNLGIGSVVKDFAREYVDAGLLFELRFNKIIPKREFCLVQNTRMPQSVAAKKLLEFMK